MEDNNHVPYLDLQISFRLLLQLDNDQCMSKGKKNWGITEFVLEIKRITDYSIFRSFGHLVRFLIHYYQQKFK